MSRVDELSTLAREIVEILRPACTRIDIAGALRRQGRTSNDVDIVLEPRTEDLLDLWGDVAEPETPDTPPRLTRNELRTQLRRRDPDNPLSVQDHADRVLELLRESMAEGDWNLVSNAVILQQSLVDRLRS